MKILIVKLSSIGDVVHTLPALASLRKGLGGKGGLVTIDWLVEEAASGILKNHPMIDNLIVVRRGWAANFRENLKLARGLASRGYDIVLDFQGLLKSGVWVRFSKGRRRVGFSNSREMSHVFLNEKLPPYDPRRHAVERYLDLARYAGGANGSVEFDLCITDKEKSQASRKLKDGGVAEGSPFFVIVPRARWATKLWRDERFVEFAKKVITRTGMRVVLVGSAADRAALERMRLDIGEKAANLAGATGLRELAAVMGQSFFVVTVDSGPMHIAAAGNARVLALFGPTSPERTGPWGKGHRVITKDLPCVPCFSKACSRKVRCMDEITVDDLMRAAEDFIRG